MYIDDLDDSGTDISSFLQTIDSVTSAIKGHVRISNRLDATQFLLFSISDLNDNTGWWSISINNQASSGLVPFTDLEDVICSFVTTGDKGDTGAQGVQGTTGIQGTQGTQGTTGTQGTQGIQGETGVQGIQGILGTQGTQGIQGETGVQGTQGTQGTTGIQGTQGTQGTTGTQGTQGIQGETGVQGIQGILGTQGTQGIQGETGVQGTQGIQGVIGVQGTQGTQGTQGITGVQGTQGTNGTQGTQGIQGSNSTIVTDDSTNALRKITFVSSQPGGSGTEASIGQDDLGELAYNPGADILFVPTISASAEISGSKIYSSDIVEGRYFNSFQSSTGYKLNNAKVVYTQNSPYAATVFGRKDTDIVVSGSTIALGNLGEVDTHVTASGNISASGELWIDASLTAGDTHVLVWNPLTGKVSHSGSYGGIGVQGIQDHKELKVHKVL